MGRSANAARDSVTHPEQECESVEGESVTSGSGDRDSLDDIRCERPPGPRQASPLAPFVLGALVGGVAGTILGTVLSAHTRNYLVGLFHLVNRRISTADRDQLRFELLLQ